MQGYDETKALAFMEANINPKIARAFGSDVRQALVELIQLDLSYMRQMAVLDEDGFQGEGEYDEDDAFEAILNSYLDAHPEADDMRTAALLNEYMALQADFLEASGLADD
mgnify:CR=1 FL=1